jgi:hypothetical protein
VSARCLSCATSRVRDACRCLQGRKRSPAACRERYAMLLHARRGAHAALSDRGVLVMLKQQLAEFAGSAGGQVGAVRLSAGGPVRAVWSAHGTAPSPGWLARQTLNPKP